MKPSRLLQRLDADIATARTTLEADCWRAERAGYWARLGRFDEVQAELGALHERYDQRPNAAISAWLNLVEGLVIYFAAVGAPTSDKLQRALALSTAAGLGPLQALCAAWLSQFDYVRVNMDSMASHLRKSLQIAAPDDHSARSRATLVAAQALHLAGRTDLAMLWYRMAHDHATAEGDDATISALMHNMAWLRMMTLRQAVLTGNGSPAGGEHALMGAESTGNFDDMVGDFSWGALKPILRAQILSLQGQFAQALELYDQHLTATESEGTSRLQANLLADKAWCLVNIGQLRAALECALLGIACLTPETHVDDRAAAHSRLAQVFAVLGDREREGDQARFAREAWRRHESLQNHIFHLLGTLTEKGHG